MEFLDIKLTKKLESFAPCYSQSPLLADFNENHILLCFQEILTKKSAEQETRTHEQHFVEQKKEDRKPDKTWVREDSSLCPEQKFRSRIPSLYTYNYIYVKSSAPPTAAHI
jgi:hypothetical protein